MKFYSVLIVLSLIIALNINECDAKGRGSSGSRGSSRSSSRSSGSSRSRGSWRTTGTNSNVRMRIKIDKYRKWTVRSNYPATSRYKTASVMSKRNAIILGSIWMTSNYKSRINIYDDQNYNDFSICLNVDYVDQNKSTTPWFACPLYDYSKRYCCGKDLEETCCSYFENPMNIAWIVCLSLIGISLVAFLISKFGKKIKPHLSGFINIITCKTLRKKCHKEVSRRNSQQNNLSSVSGNAETCIDADLDAPPYPMVDKLPQAAPPPYVDLDDSKYAEPPSYSSVKY